MSTKKLQIIDYNIKQAENADTVDGKHASDFASASDVETLKANVGDTSVSSQISTAIANKVDKVEGKGLSTNDYTTTEKNKLAGIASGAEVNQNAFSNVVVGSTTIAADGKTDTLTLAAGDNITLTPDATNDKVTIAAKDTVYTHPSYTARTGVPTANATPAFGGTFNISQPVSDATGHITAINSRTVTIPSATATTSTAGLMSAADKSKLDGISSGANKITVDSALSSTSTNPVQNKVVNSAISNLNTLVGDTSVSSQITSAIDALDLPNAYIPVSKKGAASGVAELDSSGKVPSTQLPSYVDDVLEYSAKSSFPSTGETGKIYVDTSTNLTYRWSGSAYVEISPSLALGTTSSTAFRGDYGNTAYTHATAKGSAFSSGLYKITTNDQGHVTAATAVAKSDITGLGVPAQDTTYSAATTSTAGLMSASDKSKLDGIASGANKTTVDSALSSTSTNPVQNKVVNTAISNLNTLVGDTAVSTQITNATNSFIKGLSVSGQTVTYTKGDGSTGTITTQDTNTTYSNATTSAAGLMSASDKSKLDGITSSADSVSFSSSATSGNKVGTITINGTATDMYSPTQTTISGNAGTATALATTRYIDGVSFTGAANVTRYATCSTAAATAAKTASITAGTFSLITGARVTVKFTYANTVASPTLNVGSTGAKAIYWHGAALTSSQYWQAGAVLDFVYNGTQWDLIGIAKDNNTTYSAATTSAAGLMSATDKTTLDNLNTLVGDTSVSTQITNETNNFIKGLSVSGTTVTYTKGDGSTGTITTQDTNTTYSVATASASGLMSAADKTKLNATNVAYGTCATEAATAAKVISISGNTNWALATGSIITVKFTYTNTASNPTFNVNSTGAKSVWYNTALITTSSLSFAGYANRPAMYMYDGTQYVFLGWAIDNNTTYTNASLGSGYGTCSTAEATTDKVVTLSSYSLVTGGIVSVKFTYAVPASSTMNINSKGAKNIYYRGSAITAGRIKAGDIATFIYDGTQYQLISVDRDDNTTYSAATTSTAGLMSAADKTTLNNLSTLVGDTAVSTQITNAVNSYDETNKEYINDALDNFVSIGDLGENWSDGDVIVVDTGTGLVRDGGKYVKSVNGQTGAVTISETPLSLGTCTVETSTSNLSHGASIPALTDLTVDGHEISYTTEIYNLPVETTLSLESSGTGNAVTNVSVNNHKITLTKGSTFATQSSLDSLSGLVGDTSVSSQISNAVATKQDTITGAATTIASSNLTASRALVSNSSGKVAVSSVTSTELGYLSGVTSSVQTQINSKANTIHNHVGQQITPVAIELTPNSSSAGHGGYIDFHYNNSSADYTSRIIESSSGTVALNDNKILTTANITALYSVSVTFSSGKATYSNSAIKSTSICFVQRRSSTAGSSTTCMFGTTSNNGSVTIVIDDTSVTTTNLNILILNL